MFTRLAMAASVLSAGITLAAVSLSTMEVEILDAVDALPAHIAGRFDEPLAYARATTGDYVVLDRRRHTVYGIDRAKTKLRTILTIGTETGRVVSPAAMSLAANDIFAVADAPGGHERIQYFSVSGTFLGGFFLHTKAAARVVIGPLILNGVGSLHFTGKTFLLNRPELGAVISEIDNSGAVMRHVGTLRPTGHERDADLHMALNTGIPLADPTGGGFYFVFQTGRPVFRKYDAAGAMIFERHIEGVELDRDIRALPEVWPRREDAGRLPLVPPLVRTAAVDAAGRLWISLIAPYTYVYDGNGDKIRTVQFRGADVVSAASLSFAGDRVLVTPGCYEFSTVRTPR